MPKTTKTKAPKTNRKYTAPRGVMVTEAEIDGHGTYNLQDLSMDLGVPVRVLAFETANW